MKKIGIIGAGLSSLYAACYLAKKGYSVDVFDKNKMAGGRSQVYKDNGYTFDMGPSWYWMPDVIDRLFSELDEKRTDYFQLNRLDPAYKVFWKDNESTSIPAEKKELLELFDGLEADGGKKLNRFLADAKIKYDVSMHSFIEIPGVKIGELINFKVLKEALKLDVFKSVEKDVSKRFTSDKAQNILNKEGVSLYLKLEGNNPGGSVKDRAAYNMIRSAIERNEIKKGDYLIEATSGNTGIALAMIAQQFEINIELVMPENSTKERIQTMEAYGAKVTLTPTSVGIEGSREYAENQVKEKGYFMLNQFANNDNVEAHFNSTGPEIWKDTDGKVTHFVASMGTTGTIVGTAKYLKSVNPEIKIIGVQPEEGSSIPGIRKWPKEYIPKIYSDKNIDKIIYFLKLIIENKLFF